MFEMKQVAVGDRRAIRKASCLESHPRQAIPPVLRDQLSKNPFLPHFETLLV